MKQIIATMAVCSLTACAAAPSKEQDPTAPFDPYEAQNRRFHAFNLGLDRSVVRPVARTYAEAVPSDIQTLIGRFSENTSLPSSVVNNVMRGDMYGATTDFYRLVINTTIGMGGFFDPATEFNMPPPTDTDFGQVLYAWGVGQGAYVELPVLGPNTARSTTGKVIGFFTNPLDYVIPTPESYVITGAAVASQLGDRGRYSDTIDSILYDSADGYAQARLLYLQNRQYKLTRKDQDGQAMSGAGAGGTDAYADPYDAVQGPASGQANAPQDSADTVNASNTAEAANQASANQAPAGQAPQGKAMSEAYKDPYDE